MSVERSRHACGTLLVPAYDGDDRKIIVAAGGESHWSAATKTVEFLLVSNGDAHFSKMWETGPDLPYPLINAASTTMADQKALFVIGGSNIQDHSQDTSVVLKLQCSGQEDLQCSWKKMDHELKIPTTRGVALILPSMPMASSGYLDSRDCEEGN